MIDENKHNKWSPVHEDYADFNFGDDPILELPGEKLIKDSAQKMTEVAAYVKDTLATYGQHYYNKTKHHLNNAINYAYEKGPDHMMDAFEKIDDTIDYLHRGEAREAHPDYSRDFSDIVYNKKDGFSLETHQVGIANGYELKMFRIKHRSIKPDAPVVFLQHGITDSADAWIMHDENNAPAFFLAKQGYDVWLGNWIGSKYSRI